MPATFWSPLSYFVLNRKVFCNPPLAFQVVDPSRTTAPGPVRGFVATAAAPKKVVWVPSATATLTG